MTTLQTNKDVTGLPTDSAAVPALNEIRHAISVLFRPGQVVEVRAFPTPKGKNSPTWSGYFSDHEALAQATLELATRPKGYFRGRAPSLAIYWTLQQIKPSLLARHANNYVDNVSVTTSDGDVERYEWFPIDLDPTRAAEISSSDTEKQAAREVADRIIEFLAERGISALLCDSGNGIHILFRISLPAGDVKLAAGDVKLVEQTLAGFGRKFSTGEVSVDTRNFNPSRIWKAYGTVSKKGDSTVDRPHRLSRVLGMPADLAVVGREQLVELCAELAGATAELAAMPGSSNGNHHASAAADSLDHKAGQIEQMLAEAHCEHRGRMENTTKAGGLKWELEVCPFNSNHASCSVVTLSAKGVFGFKCQHYTCGTNHWKQFRAKVAAEFRFTRPLDLSFEQRLTDTANAKRFVAQHEADFRFCAEQGIWYAWDGRRWRANDMGAVMRAAQLTALSVLDEAKAESDPANVEKLAGWAVLSLNRGKLDAMISVASRQVAVEVARFSEFDRHPHLLNCQNGVIDLKTGELAPHTRSLLITKLAAASYDPKADCTEFLKFLRRALKAPEGEQGDKLVSYAQRVLGYCFTGETREQVMFLFIGETESGKSTFIRIIRAIAAEFSGSIPEGTLVYSKQQVKDYSLLDLAAVRLATCVETAQGKKLDETRMKALTGQDTLKGERKYQQPVDFVPQAKLILATNHAPRIRATDNSVWRRLSVIQFPETVPKADQNKQLTDTILRAESNGILAWIVAGAREWYANGLGTAPKEIETAKQMYRDAEDIVRIFVGQCLTASDELTTTKEIYEAYSRWMRASNLDYPTSAISFGMEFTRVTGSKAVEFGHQMCRYYVVREEWKMPKKTGLEWLDVQL